MFNQRRFEQLYAEFVASGAQVSSGELNDLLYAKYEFLTADYFCADLPELPDAHLED